MYIHFQCTYLKYSNIQDCHLSFAFNTIFFSKSLIVFICLHAALNLVIKPQVYNITSFDIQILHIRFHYNFTVDGKICINFCLKILISKITDFFTSRFFISQGENNLPWKLITKKIDRQYK